ncbi:MAG: hypothetical protein PVF83_02755 [Anaerolineales bacterium]|jgi:hypothetical protein
MTDPIENLWAEILSRRADRVRSVFATLSTEEKEAVLNHLKRMTCESGWHPEQIDSATKALKVLHDE